MGELQPWPGTSTFQATFSVRFHVSGSAASSAIAPEVAPRNRGQFSPASLVCPDAPGAAVSASARPAAAIRTSFPADCWMETHASSGR